MLNYFSSHILPDIVPGNIDEYEQLNQEFCIPSIQKLIDNLRNCIEEGLQNVTILRNSSISDKSEIEHRISQNLDNYIKYYGEQLIKVPVQSLYNVLSYKDRLLTDYNRLYELIISENNQSDNSDLLVLLPLINSSLFEPQNLLNSLNPISVA